MHFFDSNCMKSDFFSHYYKKDKNALYLNVIVCCSMWFQIKSKSYTEISSLCAIKCALSKLLHIVTIVHAFAMNTSSKSKWKKELSDAPLSVGVDKINYIMTHFISPTLNLIASSWVTVYDFNSSILFTTHYHLLLRQDFT